MSTKTYKHFTVETDSLGIVTVTIDVQNRPMNVLTAEVMEELDAIVTSLEKVSGIELVRFDSGKESGFLAGADVSAIAEIRSRDEATRLIDGGQRLFARIEALPMPTIAILHGPCLGGGLEWALACDYRVVRADASTKIGLPEIKLGLIPGWGGTQRLPRVVGLSGALSMILSGKHLDAIAAAKIGLVDEAIAPDQWQVRLEEIKTGIRVQHVSGIPFKLVDRDRGKSLRHRFGAVMSSASRPFVFSMAMRQVRKKAAHYPAAAAAVRAIKSGFDPAVSGYVVERNEFIDLLSSQTSEHLLDLFFARERARKVSTWMRSDDIEATASAIHRPVRSVGVIGAGAMGAGIAQLAALRGFQVIVKEINDNALSAGRKRVTGLIDQYVERKSLGENRRAEILDRMTFTCDTRQLVACDLIIEAIVERADIKAALLSELDRVVGPETILASNTSSLSIGDMANATKLPQRVAGLHFFNPVHRMELVEIVQAEKTNAETIAALLGFVKAIGKTPVVTKDSPGFLVNRILFPYLGEAVLMVGEGHCPDAIDRGVRDFGMPMGPLELLDQVGIDVARHVAVSLADVLPDAERVAYFLDAMIAEGRLGKKSGMGFYRYRKGKRRSVAPRMRIHRGVPYRELEPDSIEGRLITSMLAEALRCHEESVVNHEWAIDLAMVLGTGFAPHTGGPMSLIKSMGAAKLYRRLKTLEARFGSRFATPESVIERMLPPAISELGGESS